MQVKLEKLNKRGTNSSSVEWKLKIYQELIKLNKALHVWFQTSELLMLLLCKGNSHLFFSACHTWCPCIIEKCKVLIFCNERSQNQLHNSIKVAFWKILSTCQMLKSAFFTFIFQNFISRHVLQIFEIEIEFQDAFQ